MDNGHDKSPQLAMDVAFRAVILYAAWGYCVFALALAGLCTKAMMAFSLLIPAAGGLFLLRGLASRPRRPVAGRRVWREHWAFLAVLGLAALAYSHALFVPPFARDDMMYHLLVPRQMALTGALRFDPFNLNSNFPMLFEMPLAAFEALGMPISPFIVNVAFALLFVSVFYAAAARHIPRGMAAASAAALATVPVLFDLTHTAYVEIFFALLILLAALEYFRHLEGETEGRPWLRACACLGLAAAVKYPGVLFALFFLAWELGRNWKGDRRSLWKGAALCVALASPWYIKNWIFTGNPVFPFLNSWLGFFPIDPVRMAGFKSLLADYNLGRSFQDYLLLPPRLALGIDDSAPGRLGFDGRLGLFFALTLLGLGWKDSRQRFASLLGLGFFALWAAQSQQARFLLPLLPLLAFFALRRLAALPRAPLLLGAAAALILAQNAAGIAADLRRDGILPLLLGKLDREAFLSAHMPISFGVAAEINRHLDPARHKLMTVGSFGRNYYYEIPVLTNTFYDQEVFRRYFQRGRPQPDSVEAFLDRHGITHVLFDWNFVRAMHARDTAFDLKGLEGYFERALDLALEEGAIRVYARAGNTAPVLSGEVEILDFGCREEMRLASRRVTLHLEIRNRGPAGEIVFKPIFGKGGNQQVQVYPVRLQAGEVRRLTSFFDLPPRQDCLKPRYQKLEQPGKVGIYCECER